MLEGFKEYLLNRNIKQQKSKLRRDKKFFNLQTARSALILFDASTEHDYKKVNSFVRYIQEKDIKVNALGYINDKFIPHYCMPSVVFDFISKNNLNFYYKPKGQAVENLLNSKYDMLIDLNVNFEKSIYYIFSIANASFKISICNDYQDYFDMHLKLENNKDINNSLKELIHYLENLGLK